MIKNKWGKCSGYCMKIWCAGEYFEIIDRPKATQPRVVQNVSMET